MPAWRVAVVGLATVVGGYGGWHAAPTLLNAAVPPASDVSSAADVAAAPNLLLPPPDSAAESRTRREAAEVVSHPARGSPAEFVAVTGRSSPDGEGHDSWLAQDRKPTRPNMRETARPGEGSLAPPGRGVPELPDEGAPASDPATASGPVIDQPVRVAVPAIDIEAPVVPLGLRDDGGLEVPSDFDTAGWWQGGSAPGEQGAAVIAGHVDSYTGPAVFHELHRLSAGDEVHVRGEDDTAVRFEVDRVAQHPKQAFPTDDVYGDTPEPTLRLITCGGAFDEARGRYSDNVIVFAEKLPTKE